MDSVAGAEAKVATLQFLGALIVVLIGFTVLNVYMIKTKTWWSNKWMMLFFDIPLSVAAMYAFYQAWRVFTDPAFASAQGAIDLAYSPLGYWGRQKVPAGAVSMW